MHTHISVIYYINGVKILQIRKVNRDQRITKYASKQVRDAIWKHGAYSKGFYKYIAM